MLLSHGMLSEMLAPKGWSTFALGKWHLTPAEDVNLAAKHFSGKIRQLVVEVGDQALRGKGGLLSSSRYS